MKGEWTDEYRAEVRRSGFAIGWGMIAGGLTLATIVLWRSGDPSIPVLLFLGAVIALGGAAALPDTVAPLISQAIDRWGKDAK